MKWKKKGLLYVPTGELWWAKAYAHLPTVEIREDQTVRIYFDSLDDNNFGRIGYIDLDKKNLSKVVNVAKDPILDLGEVGSFDDSGVNPSCLIHAHENTYLYYVGWQRTERVPYMLFTGLAISYDQGLTFNKFSRVPILDRTNDEPFSRATLCVLAENETFKAWYFSCVKWTEEKDRISYNNVIKYAESSDGIHWRCNDHICIAPEDDQDYSTSRPWVIKDGDLYKMWYSIRSRSNKWEYRIGYAESIDGLNWTKKDDEVGIAPSETGWDSQMICFPCVVDYRGDRYMFYSGNRFGMGGIGYAVLES